MAKLEETEIFYPADKAAWREWLEQYHEEKDAVWLMCYKKATGVPTVSWSDAVDVALCFGWIDSVRRSLDGERYIQYYGKRKARSAWSKINKDKVAQLTAEGQMSPAGMASVSKAKENGSWTLLDEAEAMQVPEELEAALRKSPDAAAYFNGLSKSVKKAILFWLALARRADTREKRIEIIVSRAAEGKIPEQFV